MKYLYLCLLIAMGGVLPLFAQDQDDGGSREAKGRVAWFVYTGLPEGLENPVSVMSGKDVSQVTLSKRSPSEPVKIPGDGVVSIVREVPDPKEPGETKFLTLAIARIPDGVSKALVILIPVENDPQGLLFRTKVQDLASFKGGDWLFFNMTNFRLGVEMGKTSLEIKPGEVRIYNSPVEAEPVNMPIRQSYFHPVKQQWKMISASTVVLHSTRRQVCIFGWDPRYERIEKTGITFPVTP